MALNDLQRRVMESRIAELRIGMDTVNEHTETTESTVGPYVEIYIYSDVTAADLRRMAAELNRIADEVQP